MDVAKHLDGSASEIQYALDPLIIRRVSDGLEHGLKLIQQRKFPEAISAFDGVLALSPEHTGALVNKAAALRQLGHPEEALGLLWRAAQNSTDQLAVWLNASNALSDLGRYEEAHAALQSVLHKAPFSSEVWQSVATALLTKRLERAAEAALRRAAALAPESSVPLIRLAETIAHDEKRVGEALELFGEAMRRQPVHPGAFSGFAQALVSLGRLDEAAPYFRRALELDGDHLDARLGTARMLLLKGDLERGWKEYEWRRKKPKHKEPSLPGPEWDGAPIAGKTLLVCAEQGLGDVLQFARYIKILAGLGAKVVFAVPVELEKLLKNVEGAALVVTRQSELPKYDYHVPLLTVPHLLGISPTNVPANIPYLHAPKTDRRLLAPFGARLKVGLVWAGSPNHANDRNRSLAIEDILPITAVTEVAFYSLQVGPRRADLARAAHPSLIFDIAPALQNFTDTAEIIPQLDLVICTDTSVAHLAGALGKPVWVLLTHAPDWRWPLGEDTTRWYPSMRLFRQTTPGHWEDVVGRVAEELAKLARTRPRNGFDGDIVFHSAFAGLHNRSRYEMGAPRGYLADPGVRFLVAKERSGIAYERATRSFLDEHLQAGGVFIDVGAHWGIMSLHAATHADGNVKAIAIEPLKSNLPFLRGWVGTNNLQNVIEIVHAAAGATGGRGRLRPDSTMGHSLVCTDDGDVDVVTIDGLLADRPHLQDGPVVVKIDVEGSEPDVVAGMRDLLDSGRVTAVIWERGITYNSPEGQVSQKALRARFDELGFTAWRFESEDSGKQLIPFVEDGSNCNVFELAPGVVPKSSYEAKLIDPRSQPRDEAADVVPLSYEKFYEASRLQSEGKISDALTAYAAASEANLINGDLYNNLGVALNVVGRPAAAEAAYRRAIALNPLNGGNWSNLGNLLRSRGRLDHAMEAHRRALALKPNDPGAIYNTALVYRDDGNPRQAQKMFEQVLALRPNDLECKWDLALVQLQQGNYREGFPGYETRWQLKRANRNKAPLPQWDGGDLRGRNIVLTDEQGFGDVLMFARFIPMVKDRGAGEIHIECQPELGRLMKLTPHVDGIVKRGTLPKKCDIAAPLLSLPRIFGITLETLPNSVPYLKAPALDLPLPPEGRTKVGLVWAGSPTPRDRGCPLDELLPAFGDPRFALYSLQVGPRAADLKKTGADIFITDLSSRLTDFAETAAVLTQMDLLVTVDTSVAHLAGALGVKTLVLLRYTSDWRWFDEREDSPWYPTLKLLRQDRSGKWRVAVAKLANELDKCFR